MKNRTQLVLMEQLVMILVFALAAAICLQLFVGADRISQQTRQQDRAVMLAQNGAETTKAMKGELSAVAEKLGGTTDGKSLQVQSEELMLQITLLAEEMPGLGQAQVQVLEAKTQDVLFALNTGWQEEVSG